MQSRLASVSPSLPVDQGGPGWLSHICHTLDVSETSIAVPQSAELPCRVGYRERLASNDCTENLAWLVPGYMSLISPLASRPALSPSLTSSKANSAKLRR